MKKIKTVLKKTGKIAVVTCVAASAVAVMTSGVALKTIGEGGKYLANAVRKIADGQDRPREILEEDSSVSGEYAAEEI